MSAVSRMKRTISGRLAALGVLSVAFGGGAAEEDRPSLPTPPTAATAQEPSPPAGGPSSTALRSLLAAWPIEGEVRPWKYVVFHHSATESGSVASLDAAHRQRLDTEGRPWRGIGYHFVIGNGHGLGDGTIATTFRWREQLEGAHAGIAEFNQWGIGICLVGDLEQSPPTRRQVAAARQLVRLLQQAFGLRDQDLCRHGDLKATACPGAYFSLAEIIGGRNDSPHPSGEPP
jgi:hypothetical protein